MHKATTSSDMKQRYIDIHGKSDASIYFQDELQAFQKIGKTSLVLSRFFIE